MAVLHLFKASKAAKNQHDLGVATWMAKGMNTHWALAPDDLKILIEHLIACVLRTRLLLRDLRAFLARFGKADGNGLLAAFHGTALTAFAGFQRALLAPFHGTLNALAGGLSVLPSS